MGIKAIETVYNGYRFRSRLEARWAVFFDTLGIKYEYESEGADLGPTGYYLPDFYLPNFSQPVWFEVKGVEPEPDDYSLQLAQALANQDEFVCLFHGDCWIPAPLKPQGMLFEAHTDPEDVWWLGCANCNFTQLCPDPASECDVCGGWTLPTSAILRKAYTAARQARFEHGETPNGR